MFTLNFNLAENDTKANSATECENMTNDQVTFGSLFSILTPFYALDKSIILLFYYYYYSLVPKKSISLSSSNESSSQPHNQHGATISDARQQG